MLYADIVVGAALIYSEQQLIGVYGTLHRIQPLHLCYTALKPAGCSLAGLLRIAPRSGVLNALVKSHCNGRAEVGLYAHTFFGSHKNPSAVHMGVEINSLLFNLTQLG